MTEFQFPPQYFLPPFFTIQLTEKTRQEQLNLWSKLICDYCKFHKIQRIDLHQIEDMPLFSNKSINRSLSFNHVQDILRYMQTTNNAIWIDSEQTQAIIAWRTPSQWAEFIWSWVNRTQQHGNLHTFHRLLTDDFLIEDDLAGLDEAMLVLALEHLQSEQKAVLIKDKGAVKFQ
ncbi:putative Vacuolar protein-sorting-associated protein 25 [Blattamonas nauphoetae]|uniref:Vacuolar protein-sorting-associated protein 25 n=1 Tax=Blattamonas nauphoetae TaxID=2049346 RepID=A0ABQ9YMI9_9EUKA|nr:putative Vacuolar protein-sorting-associated protein 25 [Blattamonas nauphoetae]